MCFFSRCRKIFQGFKPSFWSTSKQITNNGSWPSSEANKQTNKQTKVQLQMAVTVILSGVYVYSACRNLQDVQLSVFFISFLFNLIFSTNDPLSNFYSNCYQTLEKSVILLQICTESISGFYLYVVFVEHVKPRCMYRNSLRK